MFLDKSPRFAVRLLAGSASLLAAGGVAVATLTVADKELAHHPLYSLGMGTLFSVAVSSVVLGVGYSLRERTERAIAELRDKIDGREPPTVPLRIVGTAPAITVEPTPIAEVVLPDNVLAFELGRQAGRAEKPPR